MLALGTRHIEIDDPDLSTLGFQEKGLFYARDGSTPLVALSRTTHAGVFAHQDDSPIVGMHGIKECFRSRETPPKRYFSIVVTDGARCTRAGRYAAFSEEEMVAAREQEEMAASHVGDYSGVALLRFPSLVARDGSNNKPTDDLVCLLARIKPKALYTHSPIDKHKTHLAIVLRTIQAMKELGKTYIPDMFVGGEGWLALDWVPEQHKIKMDITGFEGLASALINLYDSQVAGGSAKNYAEATLGRWLANATYADAYHPDQSECVIYGLNLRPLLEDPQLSVRDYLGAVVGGFRKNVLDSLDEIGIKV